MAKAKQTNKEKITGDIPISEDSVKHIEISRIAVSRFEPQKRRRMRFKDEDTLALGESIRQNGLKQPVQLRPLKTLDFMPGAKGADYEIVFGERRFLASKAIGAKTIRAFIEDLTDAQVLELQYEENHRRQESSPLDDAFLFKFLIDTENYTPQSLADKFNKTLRTIKQTLKLNELIPDVIELFEAGKLPLKHAAYMAKFHIASQKEILDERMLWRDYDEDEGVMPFESFKDEIESEIIRRISDAPFDPEDIRLHLQGLKCSECPQNSNFEKVLFPEFSGEARCTNKTCFDLKSRIHLSIKRDEIAIKTETFEPIEEVVKKVPLVTPKSWIDKEDVPFKEKVLTNQTILPQPECEFSTLSLAVGGDEKGREVYVCNEKSCNIHNQKSEIPNHQRENLENELNVKIGLAVREVIFTDAIKFFENRTFWEFSDLVENLLAKMLFSKRTYLQNALKNLVRSFPKCPTNFEDENKNYEFVAGLEPFQKSQLLFVCTFSELGYMSWKPEPQTEVKKLAKDYCSKTINYDLIEAEKRLEFAPDEFKDIAAKHLEAVQNGESVDVPKFWIKDLED